MEYQIHSHLPRYLEEQMAKDWTSPIYGFFQPHPTIEFVDSCCCHEFKCATPLCKGKGMRPQIIRQYLKDDWNLTSNMHKHAKNCWGDENVRKALETKGELSINDGSQPPLSTDKHIAGKLSLCMGLPVMIRYNYATEICMTCSQEGFVHGWQSKQGSNRQMILDTLFVRLKDPPTCVKVPGLPDNVVPIYPTTTNISAVLPNDEKFYIAHMQVEVLVNFAMTDFGSQGKTRPWNVSDPNNLRSHQSYYTTLSRSATAGGTLILQGFDPKVITSGCSGALRQEFHELELLDDITKLRYLRKLPVIVDGDTRNHIIVAFSTVAEKDMVNIWI